ncbi:cytochrome P450 [Nostoc linckia z18]|uniref:Cytochrome P450 n=2 Tax=Nostoc linckia TaxID=92942 RepID=A0A9Q5Z8Y0_NOSLI|nr:cytochrome P450 [Nostoc linckia]PHK28602.1 cytochrome P450 [Nostoc linckia z15]PHK42700.1 cytochrome P450 [Nostoc linckia z16]PHJ61065.1 cytochrome P450 [Nostoc linckia z1]PHJ64843.1 cytochrome P450 [Nostoc linckia z3]PHJ76330.1 cytochrome P450 [Nostoc linckia z2]
MGQLKPADEIPGSYGLPFLGETLEIFRDLELYLWRRFHQYGSVFKTRVLGHKRAYLIGPDANRLVLVEQAENMSSRIGWYFLEPTFGNNILLQDGEEHRLTRRLMYPAFHGKAIATYFDIIQNIVEEFLKDWGEQGTISLNSSFRKLTLRVASRLFLGSQNKTEVEQTSQWFTQLIDSSLAIFKWNVPFTLYGRGQSARSKLVAFLNQVIAQRIKEGNLEASKDVLGLLLAAVDEDGNKLSQAQVINEALLLLFAGHETTASLLSWVIFELGHRPEWRERLRQEQLAVVGNNPLTLSHLKQFPELMNVLKETERLYPPVYAYNRGVLKDIEYAGYRIPAGWFVTISPMLTHRLPELYADPHRFDPDRFAPPREEDKKHPFALIGFGGGSHSCLGMEFAQMEMKIVLSTLLRHYDWTVKPDYSEVTPYCKASKVKDTLEAYITAL